MKHATMLTMTSLITVVLLALHLSDDIVRGFEPGRMATMWGVLIMAVWLYAALMLADRRAGCVLLLLLSILGAGVPAIHMRGAGMVGGRVAGSSGMLLWVWTLITLGATSMVSAVLAASGFWKLRRTR